MVGYIRFDRADTGAAADKRRRRCRRRTRKRVAWLDEDVDDGIG